MKTRRALDGAHVLPTKVFRRLTGSVKPCHAAAADMYTSDFPDVKIQRLYNSGESNPVLASANYNPDWAQLKVNQFDNVETSVDT